MKTETNCAQLLEIIPDELLENLEKCTEVNHQVKKLTGKIIFKLLLFSLLNSERLSLRVIETFYNSKQFQIFSGKNDETTRHTTLSDRLININSDFFKKIFEYLSENFRESVYKGSNIRRFDSTLVSISSKLLKTGIQAGGVDEKKQMKYTVSLSGDFPDSVRICNTQQEVSEEIALRKAILELEHDTNSIVVFDRGLQRRKTFCDFTDEGILFVGRLKNRVDCKEVRKFKEVRGKKSKTLKFKKDMVVYFKGSKGELIKKELRLITAISLKTGEELKFVTNITRLNAREITDIYARRWDIEVFFRFIKQELNFNHFISRNENGIKVLLYMTLIASTLLLAYKKKNNISGYKIMKLRFTQELEMEIIKEIVLLCNGDVSRMSLLNNASP
jgi:hypothetical protein